MGHSGEKILWAHFDYTYSPVLIYNKINKKFKEVIAKDKIKIKPIDKLEYPFTLDQVTMFLEACASMMFFLQKNNILKIGADNDNEVQITNEIKRKEELDFDCLRAHLRFTPDETEKEEIYLDVDLRKLEFDEEGDENDEDNEDMKISRKNRVLAFESTSGPYSEKEILTLKYYPRSVGYAAGIKELKLEKFKLGKELKKEEYPMYINMPYVSDYITYLFSRPKDD